jgi:hypothetical protein
LVAAGRWLLCGSEQARMWCGAAAAPTLPLRACVCVCLPARCQVASFQGTPLEVSYWVAHNLPLQVSTCCCTRAASLARALLGCVRPAQSRFLGSSTPRAAWLMRMSD